MEEKIREHVRALFDAYPADAKISELREEMISDLTEKYRDLVKRGFHEQEAYQKVTEGIGNVDELIHAVGAASSSAVRVSGEENWNIGAAVRNAMVPAVVIVYLLLSFLTGAWGYTWILFLMIPSFYCALELARHEYAPLPDNTGLDASDVYKRRLRLMKNLIESSILPFYFVISFLTDQWAITWIVFLIVPVLEGVYRGLKSE